jgi:hypothetical protein
MYGSELLSNSNCCFFSPRDLLLSYTLQNTSTHHTHTQLHVATPTLRNRINQSVNIMLITYYWLMKCLIYYSPEASTVFGFHASIFLLNHLLKSFHFLLQSHFPDASSSIPPAILMCFPIQLHPQPLLHNNLNKMMLFMLSLQLVSFLI